MKMMKNRKPALRLVLSLALCMMLTGCELPMTVMGDIPAPENTVTDFFDGICEGDFEKADACLSGSSIAMKNTPTDEFAAALMYYLEESYYYQPMSEIEVNGLEASQYIEFTYLDFDLLAEDLRDESSRLGKKYIKTQDAAHTAINDGVCTLTDEGAQSVAAEALDNLMTQPYQYYSADTFHIRLKYQGHSWKILMTDELFEAIAGKYSA